MALILDTDSEIFIATDAADMAKQLINRLDDQPDNDTLVYLAAAVLGCEALDVIITDAHRP